ncbi:cytochrome b-c1 complex subunit 6, mitochondrial-like isoform X2 [Macrosteles quadrilineatus]|nr:cytochrome b-c1 complex subunit 6, mitochondrial-like isoform X2 [Macrosteles quadrilineatus]
MSEKNQEPQLKPTLHVYVPGKPRRDDVKEVHGGDTKMECDVTQDEGDDELVDPQEKLKECCRRTEECNKLRDVLQQCNDRVNSKTKTNETCEIELYDYTHCVDHCVAKVLFQHLK